MASICTRYGATLIRMDKDFAFTLPTDEWKKILKRNQDCLSRSTREAWFLVADTLQEGIK